MNVPHGVYVAYELVRLAATYYAVRLTGQWAYDKIAARRAARGGESR